MMASAPAAAPAPAPANMARRFTRALMTPPFLDARGRGRWSPGERGRLPGDLSGRGDHSPGEAGAGGEDRGRRLPPAAGATDAVIVSGDVIKAEVESIGTLTNYVIKEKK